MTTVVIPWRDDGDRATGCRAVCTALRAAFPGAPIMLVDSGHEPFNRAASRNHGVRLVDAFATMKPAPDPHEVVVVSDADVIPDQQALLNAVNAAHDGRLHYPFVTCHYLTEAGTADVLAGGVLDPTQIEFMIPGAQGGLMVMLASAWSRAGGMDEQYTGWGYEDNAWHRSVTSALGDPVRHTGDLYHLWHPSDRNTVTLDEARNLARYRARSS